MPRQRMSYEDARALTDALRVGGAGAPLLLRSAQALGVAASLGYTSWRAYLTHELRLSELRAAELLDVADVLTALTQVFGPEAAATSVTRAQLSRVHPQLAAFTALIAQAREDGLNAEEALHTAVSTLPAVLPRADAALRRSMAHHPAGKAASLREPEGASPSAPPGTRPCPVCCGHGFLVQDTPD